MRCKKWLIVTVLDPFPFIPIYNLVLANCMSVPFKDSGQSGGEKGEVGGNGPLLDTVEGQNKEDYKNIAPLPCDFWWVKFPPRKLDTSVKFAPTESNVPGIYGINPSENELSHFMAMGTHSIWSFRKQMNTFN